jgi:DNA-binding MarR family transcriptional regulator
MRTFRAVPKKHANEAEQLYAYVSRSARRMRELDRNRSVTSERVAALETLAEQGPLGPTELAALQGVSVSGTCRLLRELRATGMIRRKEHPEDPRRYLAEPTAAGHRLLARMRKEKIAQLRSELGQLSARDRAGLRRALSALEASAAAR